MQVLISVDDGCQDDIKLARLFELYGLNAVFFWPVDMVTLGWIKGWQPLKPSEEHYIARNFEIGSHGVTHAYLTQIKVSEAKTEVFDSKEMLERKYDKQITKFCYPRGYSNSTIRKFVENAGYDYARSTAIGHIGEPDDPLFAGSAVHMGCPVRPEYEGTNWMEYGMKLFRQAKEENKDFHAWCHSWEITKYNEWNNVRKFLKEISR